MKSDNPGFAASRPGNQPANELPAAASAAGAAAAAASQLANEPANERSAAVALFLFYLFLENIIK